MTEAQASMLDHMIMLTTGPRSWFGQRGRKGLGGGGS